MPVGHTTTLRGQQARHTERHLYMPTSVAHCASVTCWRRRPESNRRGRLCRPLPKPLGHAAKRAYLSRDALQTRDPSASNTCSEPTTRVPKHPLRGERGAGQRIVAIIRVYTNVLLGITTVGGQAGDSGAGSSWNCRRSVLRRVGAARAPWRRQRWRERARSRIRSAISASWSKP